jgi:hypothetical protein
VTRARKSAALPTVAELAPAPIAETPSTPEVVTSIKGFGPTWQCRGYQFEVGGTYTHDGPVMACEGGFHAVAGYPLEVFSYYPPAGSRYAEVVQSGALSRHGSDSKLASATVSLTVELSLGDLIQRAVAWIFDRSTPEEGSQATGVRGAASATGVRGAASATGVRGAASATGVRGAASATGWSGAASATGVRGAASATGVRGAASATGVRGAASATGVRGAASATGWSGAASATGVRGAASATGESGAAMSSGPQGCVQGAEGCALFLVYRDDGTGDILHAWAGIAGRSGITPLTWYRLGSDGQPVEVTP